MLFKLAFRNIFRNFRRTLLTMFAIAFGLGVLLLMDSMLTGLDVDSFTKVINYETGHIKIFQRGYQEDVKNLPLDKSIDMPAKIIDEVSRDKNVEGITSRINFRIFLSDGIDQFPAIGIAINPEDDTNVFKLKQAVEEGKFINKGEEAMLIGEGLAEDFNVGVGDYLTVLTRTKYETYQALDLRIKGILKTEDPKIDWAAIVIPLGVGQDSLDMGKAVTEIDIKLKDISQVDKFRDKLAKELTGLEIMTWKDLAEDVIAISETKRGFSSLIFSAVVIIALIGISNTILLSAYERVREIGMMAAMGMRRKQIRRLFIYEGALIGLFGSIFGCLLGAAMNYPLVRFGINWGFMMRDMGDIGYRITGASYGVWRLHMFLIALIFGVVVSAIVSVYPAWVASKMEPTEALKKA
ncbi:MAG: FtsX-like permease family protein [Candidatus Margulisiibacteriota bacterium]|nr:FtsX-like permease family protein [Candidatus Margulisiibacteriota bacterium]